MMFGEMGVEGEWGLQMVVVPVLVGAMMVI